ncbi:hypothetical protein Kfla_3186 [Kribbella flavida DSM 17836]|uniref:Uncharacterized protein n=1 Tax=Kribbella flavida (strain DSM 17836 / JCM 10339 / NBRC 14399) TaxID=479435 RepID=D2Q4D5_KRIFD|nr:hypothetical protein [Kribbella flavida]ADB32249.1 hypothetical protein Kfla_3186 [Kribbella flavida DSM 17836]
MLLLLAAGVTFLAVTWDSLPVAAQAAIMATLAGLALAGTIPAARHKLTGTAEALAVLGCGLLAVDLYGIRALGLIAPDAVAPLTYTAIAAALVAAVNLLLHRVTPTVKTFAVGTVLIGQLPLPLLLADRVDFAFFLLSLLGQLVTTLFWSTRGNRLVRVTGAICTASTYAAIVVLGIARVLLALVTSSNPELTAPVDTSLTTTLSVTAAVLLTTATGIALLHRRALPRSLDRVLLQNFSVVAAAFTLALCLPQVPGAGRWLTTALATILALVALLGRTNGRTAHRMLLIATITTATTDVLVLVARQDLQQLSLVAALTAALTPLAARRKHLTTTAAALTTSLSAQLAILLVLADGLVPSWPAATALAVVAACSIGAATLSLGKPSERALLAAATSALLLAELVILTVSPATGTGVVLTIATAPLIAYGLQPRRRDALLLAAALLITASTAFVLGSGTTTVEWFTVPPAAIMLTVGVLRWRHRASWLFLGPGLLLGLAPSTLIATSNDTARSTILLAVAVAIILIGTRRTLQAPFVLGAAVLTKIAVWQLLEVAPLIPRWTTLALAGAVLLTVGATYERRLHQAKQAAHWISSLR